MNCTQALEQLLDADLGATGTEHGGALAAHIAGCERCERAAATLRSGTLALAQAVAFEPGAAARPAVVARETGWLSSVLVPRVVLHGAALAALAFMMTQMVISDPPPPASMVAVTAPTVAVPAPVSSPTSAGLVTTKSGAAARRIAQIPLVAAPTPERVEPRFFASEPVRVAAVEATPFVVTNSANALPVTPENRADAARLPEIIVTNRLGTHAMVSRTADPNIVVVWLSAEPTRRNP